MNLPDDTLKVYGFVTRASTRVPALCEDPDKDSTFSEILWALQNTRVIEEHPIAGYTFWAYVIPEKRLTAALKLVIDNAIRKLNELEPTVFASVDEFWNGPDQGWMSCTPAADFDDNAYSDPDDSDEEELDA